MTASAKKQLVEAPASDSSNTYETLGYVQAYDAVLNGDYAFVAYKETNRSGGDWRVRIKGLQTAGAVFEPAMIQSKARETSAQGKPHFAWGFAIDPSAGDPRQVQFRVHCKDGAPTEIEMFLQLRKFDHSADAPNSVRFAWPKG